MKKFEIFYTDLTPEAQERFDQFLGSEGGDNFGMFPIAFMELEEDDTEGEEYPNG